MINNLNLLYFFKIVPLFFFEVTHRVQGNGCANFGGNPSKKTDKNIFYERYEQQLSIFQTKPRMTLHGDLYYEGKEFEIRLKEKKPGDLSDDLRTALGMPVGPNAHKVRKFRARDRSSDGLRTEPTSSYLVHILDANYLLCVGLYTWIVNHPNYLFSPYRSLLPG